MKIVHQGFEPQQAPVNATGPVAVAAKLPMRRKARLQLRPVAVETRLFHAL